LKKARSTREASKKESKTTNTRKRQKWNRHTCIMYHASVRTTILYSVHVREEYYLKFACVGSHNHITSKMRKSFQLPW